MSDAVLDDPGVLAARERFWTAALTDERYRENRVAVAERDDSYRNGSTLAMRVRGRPVLDVGPAFGDQPGRPAVRRQGHSSHQRSRRRREPRSPDRSRGEFSGGP
jgi:hypothetical protein